MQCCTNSRCQQQQWWHRQQGHQGLHLLLLLHRLLLLDSLTSSGFRTLRYGFEGEGNREPGGGGREQGGLEARCGWTFD